MGKILGVPVRTFAALPLLTRPEVKRASGEMFRHTFFGFDIDQTLLRSDKTEPPITTTFSNRPILAQFVSFLERAVPIVVISGNDMEEQASRVVAPLESALKGTGLGHLLRNFTFFANKGASRYSFNPEGEWNKAAGEAHSRRHGISADDNEVIRATLESAFPDFIWEAKKGKRIEVRRYLGSTVQITLKPFEVQSEREKTVRGIQHSLEEAGIAKGRYEALLSGSSSVDINRRGVDKASALRLMMEELSIPEESFEAREIGFPVFYFGDEFTLTADSKGGPVYGNDMSVLRVPNVIAFAVNLDQTQVPAHPRLINAGAGPQATLEILRYFSLLSEASRHLPRGARVDLPDARVPLFLKKEITIPEPLSRMDFKSTAVVLRINSLLADPARESCLDGNLTARESYVLSPVARLLEKGVRVALFSGDESGRQFEVIEKLFGLLTEKAAVKNLLLYADGGATKTAFSNEGDNLSKESDTVYGEDKRLGGDDAAQLTRIAAEVVKEYRQRLEVRAKQGDREAQLYLTEASGAERVRLRSESAQLAIEKIMPEERDRLIHNINQRLAQDHADLAGKYAVRSGGFRTIEINRLSANKCSALKDLQQTAGAKEVLYLGTEFFIRLKPDGSIWTGNDMEVLALENLTALGLNQDQEEVISLKAPRIIPAGSGSTAAYAWLKYLADNLHFGV
ncbi:MAG: hypothetical protein JW873_04700 [Candidatus Saganbacteria bacterium]|nr:hypothetical protein [Candidatus Saganbacteria bacterium]